ncbi:MAG TPA: hypothetical protein VGL71_09735, partial [Urbifossiella sp.]
MAVSGAAIHATAEVDDPFPIARVRIAEDRVAEVMKRHDADTMLRLPRVEFEARVRKAALATARREPPRLVEATYSAALSGNNLAGNAEWTILNPQPRPVFFPLDPLKIAVHSPTWADGTAALLGSFGPGFPMPGLWVPAGRQILKLQWSAAGAGSSTDRQFELRVPPCSSVMLDLELPSDRVPTSAADMLLTGPFPVAKDPKLRTWRFRFGDRSRLDFGIRVPGDGSGIGLAALAAKYDFQPGRIACTFEFDLRVSRGSVSEWTFALDPGLMILDAIVNDRSGWHVDPATHLLHVGLRQPAGAGKVVISATAPLPPPGQTAALPTVRVPNALLGDERLELRVHPDLELEHLEAADYRIADAATNAEGSRLCELVGELLPGGNAMSRRSPSVRLTNAGADFRTNEELEWQIEAGRTMLAARVEVRVRRGPLFRMAFRTPRGFAFSQAASTPENAISYAGATAGGVEVEFARPLATGQQVELSFEFRGPVLPPRTTHFSFPQFAPLGSAERDGWISFAPGTAWSVGLQPHTGTIVATEFDWPMRAPADAVAAYIYRGKEPEGDLSIAPVQPVFSATVESHRVGTHDSSRILLKVAS